MTKRLKDIRRKSFGNNIIGFNLLYDFGEAKITDGRIPWLAGLLLRITISSNPGYVFCNRFTT